jgi:predicted transcriptional regulator
MNKTARQLERHLKGVANHRRIDILVLISSQPGITLEGIATGLDTNLKTISEHTRRLVAAGLVNKKYQGKFVTHELSPYGKKFHKFLSDFN